MPDAESWPRAIVFDLDGTLADTAPDIRKALNQALAEEQLEPIDLMTVKTMIGAGPRVLVQRALALNRAAADEDRVDRLTAAFNEHYDASGNALSRLFPDVEPCLEALGKMGIRLGICSNKPEPFCAKLLSDLGVGDCFAAIQGYGSGLPPKPDPAPLLATIARLGATPAQTLYVGDSETDVQTARAAEVPCALVGHGYTVTPVESLGGDWLLDTLADLPALSRRRDSA
jgi:phosphoglycolate phosphatase